MRLYLLRHEMTDWNLERKIQGSSNIELNEEGKRRADALAPFFDKIELVGLYCSTLSRTVETIERATRRKYIAVVEEIAALDERNCGEWEGMNSDEYQARMMAIIPEGMSRFDFRAPGGESINDVRARVLPFFEKILHDHGNDSRTEVLITTSQIPAKIMMYYIGGYSRFMDTPHLGNGGMHIAQYKDGLWIVEKVNYDPRL